MKPSVFEDQVLAWWGPFPVTHTMLTSLVTSLILIALAAVLGRAVLVRPASRLASAARLTFRWLRALVEQAAGKPSPWLEVFAGSLFLFIAAAALLGQFPHMRAPTANLSATSALAVWVFIAVPVSGIAARGPIRYLKEYFRPNPLLFPLHVISELSRTLALAVRLFGNMMSGHLVVALIVSLVGPFLPVPLMALDLLIGLLQAYIFAILACVYIGAAMRVGEAA
jgi:F-type H+-transporting ATPase subunit a